jgi:hypothetical protein
MNVDIEFLKKTVDARRDVVKWLNERPYTGLSVTDVDLVVQGYDYLVKIIRDLTGEDLTEHNHVQIEQPTMTITFGEDTNETT